MTHPAPTLTMMIRNRRYAVASLAEASTMFCAARDKAGTGSSRTPTPLIYDGAGEQIAYISYNGRVWAGHPHNWAPNRTPIYDNRTA